MDKFLETENLPRLDHKEIENLSRPTASKEIESVLKNLSTKKSPGDFPGGPVVKNSPSNAEDAGSTPGRGTKIQHATEQLSPCTTTTELVHLNERACVPQTTEPMSPGACVQ